MSNDNRLMTNEEFEKLQFECLEIVKELEVEYDKKMTKIKEDVKRVMEYEGGIGSNIEMEIIKCHSALCRFSDLLSKERHAYNIMKNRYDRLYAQEVDNAKCNPKMFRTQNELDGAVIRNTKTARAKTFLDSYLEYIDYIDQSIKNVNTKSYGLKTIIEYRKIEKGT